MKSAMLQNPSAPEDTFRSKAGKEHWGYAVNLEESVTRRCVVLESVYKFILELLEFTAQLCYIKCVTR